MASVGKLIRLKPIEMDSFDCTAPWPRDLRKVLLGGDGVLAGHADIMNDDFLSVRTNHLRIHMALSAATFHLEEVIILAYEATLPGTPTIGTILHV